MTVRHSVSQADKPSEIEKKAYDAYSEACCKKDHNGSFSHKKIPPVEMLEMSAFAHPARVLSRTLRPVRGLRGFLHHRRHGAKNGCSLCTDHERSSRAELFADTDYTPSVNWLNHVFDVVKGLFCISEAKR